MSQEYLDFYAKEAEHARLRAEKKASQQPAEPTQQEPEFTLVDGDSGYYNTGQGEEHIRFTGFNTGEKAHKNRFDESPNAQLGQQTTQALLDNGANVQRSGEQGYYGRELATLSGENGENLGHDLVRAGIALPTKDEKSAQAFYDGISRTALGRNPTHNEIVNEAAQHVAPTERNFENVAFGQMQPKDRRNILEKSWSRGVDEMQASFGGLFNYLGELTGNEDLAQFGHESRTKNQLEASFSPREVESYEHIKSVDDAATYIVETLGEMAPSLVADGLITLATLGGGLSVVAARHAATTVVTQSIKQKAISAAKGKAIKRSLMAGPVVSGMAQSAGAMENRLDAESDGEHGLASTLSGVVGGVLNLAPYAAVFGDIARTAGLGDDVIESVTKGMKGWATNAATTSIKGGGAEGAASLAQMVIDDVIYANELNKDWDDITTNYVDDTIRAVLGGGIAAGGASGIASGVSVMREYSEARRLADAEAKNQNADLRAEAEAFNRMYSELQLDDGAEVITSEDGISGREERELRNSKFMDGDNLIPVDELKKRIDAGSVTMDEVREFVLDSGVNEQSVPLLNEEERLKERHDRLHNRARATLDVLMSDDPSSVESSELEPKTVKRLASLTQDEPAKAAELTKRLAKAVLSKTDDPNKMGTQIRDVLGVFKDAYIKRADILSDTEVTPDWMQGYYNVLNPKAEPAADTSTFDKNHVAENAEVADKAKQHERKALNAKYGEVNAMAQATLENMRQRAANVQDPTLAQAFNDIVNDVAIDTKSREASAKLKQLEQDYGVKTNPDAPVQLRWFSVLEAADEQMRDLGAANEARANIDPSEVYRGANTIESVAKGANPTAPEPKAQVKRVNPADNKAIETQTKETKTKPAPKAEKNMATARAKANLAVAEDIIKAANGERTPQLSNLMKHYGVKETSSYAKDVLSLRKALVDRVTDTPTPKPTVANTQKVTEAKASRKALEEKAGEAWEKSNEGEALLADIARLEESTKGARNLVNNALKKGQTHIKGMTIHEVAQNIVRVEQTLSELRKAEKKGRKTFVSDYMDGEYHDDMPGQDSVVEIAQEFDAESTQENSVDALYDEGQLTSTREVRAAMEQRQAHARGVIDDLSELLPDVSKEAFAELERHLTRQTEQELDILGLVESDPKNRATNVEVLGGNMQQAPTATAKGVRGFNEAKRLSKKAVKELSDMITSAFTREFADKKVSFDDVEQFLRKRGIIGDSALTNTKEDTTNPYSMTESMISRSLSRLRGKDPKLSDVGRVFVTQITPDGRKVRHTILADEIVKAGLVTQGRKRHDIETGNSDINNTRVDIYTAFLDGLSALHNAGIDSGDSSVGHYKLSQVPANLKIWHTHGSKKVDGEKVSKPLTLASVQNYTNLVTVSRYRSQIASNRGTIEAMRDSLTAELKGLVVENDKDRKRKADIEEQLALLEGEVEGYDTDKSLEVQVLIDEYREAMASRDDSDHFDHQTSKPKGNIQGEDVYHQDFERELQSDAEAEYWRVKNGKPLESMSNEAQLFKKVVEVTRKHLAKADNVDANNPAPTLNKKGQDREIKGKDKKPLSQGDKVRLMRRLRKEVTPHKVVKGLWKLTHTLRTRLERIHPNMADMLFARTGEDSGLPNFERDSRFMRESFESKWAAAMRGQTAKDIKAAWLDAQTGSPKTELGKRAHKLVSEFTAEISKANPNYKMKGLPVVIDTAKLNSDIEGFKEILNRANIKFTKNFTVDDLVHRLMDAKGVAEFAIRPENPSVVGGQGFMDILRPAVKDLQRAGFIDLDSESAMARFIASGSAFATWSKIFGAKNKKGEFNENALYEYYKQQVPPEYLGEFRRLVAGATGQFSADTHPWINRLNSVSFTLTAATVLWFSGIASIPEIGVAAGRTRGDVKGLGKDIISHLRGTTRRERDDLAELFGTVTPSMMRETLMATYDNGLLTIGKTGAKVTQAVFKYNGQEFITRMTRSLATQWGIKFIEQHARLAAEGNDTSVRLLKELRLTHKDVTQYLKDTAVNGGVPKLDSKAGAKVATAIRLFVDESVSNPHAGQMPLWMSDPRFSILSSLKKFYYAYWDNFHRSVFGEMRKRKADGRGAMDVVMPLAVSAAVMLPLAAVSEFLRELWKYPAEIIPVLPKSFARQRERDLGDHLVGIAQATGGLGILQNASNAWEQHGYGRNFAVSAAGPTVTFATELLSGDVMTRNPSRILGPINQTPWLRKPINKTWSGWIKEDEY
ncbi:thermonuclease family protein [Shewanella gaetbuli]|uniref:Uncharacterized protein n=1 Tax=Shewanella gaetbuli TaxID=220752 RepID=A0A9X2CLU6_9GAMM|nr:hypothetical protein [Shewanella gaetbuli]MCL1142985.1 hypothetical protein [Shewanella gaetbuli]